MANTIPGLNISVAQYEQVWGKKIRMMVDHYGPATYSNMLTSSGTGDVIHASDFNRGGIEDAVVTLGGYSQSGNYYAKAIIFAANGMPLGSAAATVTLQWWTTTAAFGALNAEVTNGSTALIAETVRLVLTMV